MAKSFKYASIEESDFTVHVLSASRTFPESEECYMQDLLVRIALGPTPSRLILSIRNETFLLYSLQVDEISVSSVEDAVSTFDAFIRSDHGAATSMFYRVQTELAGSEQKSEDVTCFTTLTRAHGPFFNSVTLPIADADLLNSHLEARRHQGVAGRFRPLLSSAGQTWNKYVSLKLTFWTTLLACCLIVAIIYRGDFMTHFHQHFENGVWVRYDIKGSEGPQYQLQFTHHNASNWASNNPHNNNEWALRIDDQAMIPASLMDEEELLYQRWFQKRYPEMNNIRLNQDYINETFLSDPDQIKVPSDKTFHMAHCVRALRRYWQAKETGKHVCPRDIDYRHMKHCLDSLDEWAFPDGERGSVKNMVDSGRWIMIWETKVCF